MRHLESRLQQVCVKYARYQYRECSRLLFAIPNGMHTSASQARIAYSEGMVAGVSDLIFLHPSADKRYYALCIEFKWGKGRQSEYQKEWQKALEETMAYKYEVVRSFEEFRTVLDDYLTAKKMNV